MQPLDIGRLVTLGDTAVSPDGRRIAFTVRRVDLDRNRCRSAVWLAAADGSGVPYQLTSGKHGDGGPVWSPEGTRLAFTTGRGKGVDGSALRVVPVGVPGETVTVCERVEAISDVAWSPDGSRIAFVSRERTARYDTEDERAREPRRIDRLFSRVDGAGWIIDRPASVFVVPVDGSAAPRVVAGGPYERSAPAWSPDSRTLAVVAAREPGWDLREHEDLYLVDPDPEQGAAPRLLSTSGRSHRLPAFSPDGTRIATLVNDSRIVPAHARPTVVDARTGTERTLGAELDRTCAPLPGIANCSQDLVTTRRFLPSCAVACPRRCGRGRRGARSSICGGNVPRLVVSNVSSISGLGVVSGDPRLSVRARPD
ncbi:MAG: hypothetical protein L0I76_18675 [Pseudonocardia sp.]|nr:hypothetical protein [Pseudonocardia sp.]